MSNDTVSTNDDSIENQNPSADTFLPNLPYDDAEDIFDVRHNLPAEVSDATTPERALTAQLLRVEQDRMQQCADAIAKVDGFTFDSIIAFSSLKPVAFHLSTCQWEAGFLPGRWNQCRCVLAL